MKVCEMFGFENREDALQHKIDDIMAASPTYMQNDFLPLIWKAKDGEQLSFEWLAKHTSGRLFWIEVT